MSSSARYLEYRFQRGQILQFRVSRKVDRILARPSGPFLRLLGKPFKETKVSHEEEWQFELRVADVRPDWTALCKSQVSSASLRIEGVEGPFPKEFDPTTYYLNETVDRFGMLSEQQGQLPTSFLCPFPEEAMSPGNEWQRDRTELLPHFGEGGGGEPQTAAVRYRCTLLAVAELDGIELAEVAVSGETVSEGAEQAATYSVEGRMHFAVRDGHLWRAQITRTHSVPVGKNVLTNRSKERFRAETAGTEQSVGGLRL